MYHDFMPWDDDVDLRVSLNERSRIYDLIRQQSENSIQISNITDHYGNYDHLYFPWSPHSSLREWSYPYVDIFYYDENATHLWRPNNDRTSIEYCAMSKRDIFPTVRRPFGSIWLSVSFLIQRLIFFLSSNSFD